MGKITQLGVRPLKKKPQRSTSRSVGRLTNAAGESRKVAVQKQE